MPMQMDRMIVAAVVDELQPVTLALMQRDGFGVGVGFAIDHPTIDRAVSGKLGFKDQRDVRSTGAPLVRR